MKRPTSLSLFVDISGVYREGCAAFASVSPNVVADESVMKTDEGMTMEQRYTVVGLSCFFMHCIICLNWDLLVTESNTLTIRPRLIPQA